MSASDYESINDSKANTTIYTYLQLMVFGNWSLLTHLASVLQDLLTFPLQYSSIFLIWIYRVEWDSLDLLFSGPSGPHPYRASLCGHQYSLRCYSPHWVIISAIILFHHSTSYIHPASNMTASLHATYLRPCRLSSLLYLSSINHISYHHHWYTQFCALRSPSL